MARKKRGGRGREELEKTGKKAFSKWCTGNVWALRRQANQRAAPTLGVKRRSFTAWGRGTRNWILRGRARGRRGVRKEHQRGVEVICTKQKKRRRECLTFTRENSGACAMLIKTSFKGGMRPEGSRDKLCGMDRQKRWTQEKSRNDPRYLRIAGLAFI